MSTSTAPTPRARSERASVLSAVPAPAKTMSTWPPLAASPCCPPSCAPPAPSPAWQWPAPLPALREPSRSVCARWWVVGAGVPSPSSRRPVPDAGPSPPGSPWGRGRAAPCPAPRCGTAASPRARPAGGSGAPPPTAGPW
eukprot:6082165-Pleurochrysis_carterae.AAC.1